MKSRLNKQDILDKLWQNKNFYALFLLVIVASLRYDNFLTAHNLTNIIKQSSINVIVSIGMMLVIVTGGIDLSVGAVAALAAVLSAKTIGATGSTVAALVIAIAAGALVGLISGLLVTKLEMNAFIATLATQFFARGLTHVFSGSRNISVNKSNTAFVFLGRGMIFDIIPTQTAIFLLILLVIAFILVYTSFGRSIYAVGGNKEASKMMGIPANRTIVAAHIISGVLAAIAGIILCARLGSGQPISGDGYETDAIAAVVMGGTLLTGGWGTMRGTFVGIITLGILNNVLNLEGNLSSWWQKVIIGTLLLIIIIAQSNPQSGTRRLGSRQKTELRTKAKEA